MLAVVLTLAAVICGVSCIATTTVSTAYGPVTGYDFTTYRRWQGIPFAAPPLGKLRWRNPIPPSPWTHHDSRNFTIGCAQLGHSLDIPKNVSEDCLYLEVWAPPAGKYKTPASVMVWFYGGDFKEGGESFKIYDGKHIASSSNTIVVVPNYRVGVMGFLFTGVTDPNVGIADQRWALAWVQSNAAAFGGDAQRVTIFGQSAGGESVLLHFACPHDPAARHFQRGVCESGPIPLSFKDPGDALLLAGSLAAQIDCGLNDLACLQAVDTHSVLEAARNAIIVPNGAPEAVMRFAPVVDGVSIPRETYAAFVAGDIVDKPLLIGSNLNDGKLFSWAISPKKPMIWEEYVALVAGIFQDHWVFNLLEAYPVDFFGDNRPALSHLLTDYMFLCAARRTARLAEAAGLNHTYLYQFTHQAPFHVWPKSQAYCDTAVCHGDEIPYVYHDSGAPFPWTMAGADQSLSLAMADYWTHFAATGAPGTGGGALAWPLYRAASDHSMNLQWPLGVKSGLNKPNCDLFDRVGFIHHANVRRAALQRARSLTRSPHSLHSKRRAGCRACAPTRRCPRTCSAPSRRGARAGRQQLEIQTTHRLTSA